MVFHSAANAGEKEKAPLPEALHQPFGQVALSSKDLPCRAVVRSSSGWAGIGAAIGNPEGHHLPLMVNEQVWSLKPKNQPMVVRPRLARPCKSRLRLMRPFWQPSSLVLSAQVMPFLATEIMSR